LTDTKYHYHDFSENAKLRAFIRNTAADKEITLIPISGSGFVAISRPDPCDNKPVLDAIQHLEAGTIASGMRTREAISDCKAAIRDLQSTIIKAAGVIALLLAGVIVVLLI
jgi:hypothetical protein